MLVLLYTFSSMFFEFLLLFIFSIYLWAHDMAHIGSLRTTFKSQFSPSIIWVTGIEFLRGGKHLYLQSHLASSSLNFCYSSVIRETHYSRLNLSTLDEYTSCHYEAIFFPSRRLVLSSVVFYIFISYLYFRYLKFEFSWCTILILFLLTCCCVYICYG